MKLKYVYQYSVEVQEGEKVTEHKGQFITSRPMCSEERRADLKNLISQCGFPLESITIKSVKLLHHET